MAFLIRYSLIGVNGSTNSVVALTGDRNEAQQWADHWSQNEELQICSIEVATPEEVAQHQEFDLILSAPGQVYGVGLPSKLYVAWSHLQQG